MQVKEIKSYLMKGNNGRNSHMIVWCDKWDYSYGVTYVEHESDIYAEIKKIEMKKHFEVKEIYNYSLDLEDQLGSSRCFNIKPLSEVRVDTISTSSEALNLNEDYNLEEIIRELSSSSRIKEAIDFASSAHKKATRKDGTPYIIHPLKVAQYIKVFKAKSHNLENLIIAGILHDTIEDTPVTFNDIARLFGIEVASLVLELTNNKKMKKELGKVPYLEYKMEDMTSWGLTIKLCDTLNNVSDLNTCDDEFRVKSVTERTEMIAYLLENRKLSTTQLNIISDIISYLFKASFDLKDAQRKLVELSEICLNLSLFPNNVNQNACTSSCLMLSQN